jgi:hypothetical protein
MYSCRVNGHLRKNKQRSKSAQRFEFVATPRSRNLECLKSGCSFELLGFRFDLLELKTHSFDAAWAQAIEFN